MPGIFNIGRAGNLIAPLLLAILLGLTPSCTETNFAGGAAKVTAQKKKKPRDSSSSGPQSLDMDFSGDKKIESVQNSKIWTATKNGIIKRFSIEGDKFTELKWDKDKAGNLNKAGNINGSGYGIRTYLTEGGGLIGARFPYLYFVDPDSTTVQSINIYPNGVPNGRAENRICIASYLKDSKRYLIAVWGEGDFMEIPLSNTAPYAPLWDPLPAKQTAPNWPTGAAWGYSCFIDQQQKIFYSQLGGARVHGLNLKTFQLVDIDVTVSNAKFTSANSELAKYSKSVTRSSYAVSGDSYGNLFNHLVDGLSDGYTSAHDKTSDTVWFSHRAGPYVGRIMVIERKCLTSERNCTSANYHLYPPVPQLVTIPVGPISALRDGRIAGLVRNASGDVYTMKLADPKNIKSSIEFIKVGSAGGDPYMYTDFTGATLYINEAEQTFKPADMPKYAASKPIKMAVFKWVPTPAAASAGLIVEWKNIKLEARCYSGTTKPAFAEIGKVYDSSQGTALDVESCKAPNYEFVDVKLTQLNNDTTLLGVDTISVGFKQ
jgi:hypothetical protein